MKMKGIISILITLALTAGLLCLAACSGGETTTADERVEKPIIAVSIIPEQTFAEAVCGDLAEVITMIPPGGSPANYEPTAPGDGEFCRRVAVLYHRSAHGGSEHPAERR